MLGAETAAFAKCRTTKRWLAENYMQLPTRFTYLFICLYHVTVLSIKRDIRHVSPDVACSSDILFMNSSFILTDSLIVEGEETQYGSI